MPAKNIVKVYVENGYYHVYNRGVEKRNIFLDEQDYKVFLHFLKRYLTKPPESPDRIQPGWKSDLFDKINLLAYCLMPNHFHLLIKQSTKEAMAEFVRALSNSYIRYFNEKYERIGPLFQGTYKAVLVETEPYLLHLTRYIHLNPCELELREVKPGIRFNLRRVLESYPYSSYGDYLGKRKTTWIHPEEILAFFENFLSRLPSPPPATQALRAGGGEATGGQAYQSFVEDYKEDSKEILGSLIID